MSVRRVNRLPQLGLEPTRGARSIAPNEFAPNESGDPLNAFYSGFFYDDDEVEGDGPNLSTLSTLHPSRQTVTSRYVHSNHALRHLIQKIVKGHPSSLVSLLA